MNAQVPPRKTRKPSTSRITKAVRDAIAGHKAAGEYVSETVVEVEGKRIRIRIRTEPALTSRHEGELLGEHMVALMGAPVRSGASGRGKSEG